jgi:hypothetical protein
MRHIILSAVVVLTGLAAALAQASTVDDEREIRAAVDAYTAVFNKRDFDGVLAYLAADADLIDVIRTKKFGASWTQSPTSHSS